MSELQKYTIETIMVDNDGNASDHNEANAFYPAAQVDARLALMQRAVEWQTKVLLAHGFVSDKYSVPAEFAEIIRSKGSE